LSCAKAGGLTPAGSAAKSSWSACEALQQDLPRTPGRVTTTATECLGWSLAESVAEQSTAFAFPSAGSWAAAVALTLEGTQQRGLQTAAWTMGSDKVGQPAQSGQRPRRRAMEASQKTTSNPHLPRFGACHLREGRWPSVVQGQWRRAQRVAPPAAQTATTYLVPTMPLMRYEVVAQLQN